MSDTEEIFDQLNAESDKAGLRENARIEKARKQAACSLVMRIAGASAVVIATRYCMHIGQMGDALADVLNTAAMVYAGAWIGGWMQYRFGNGGAMYGKI